MGRSRRGGHPELKLPLLHRLLAIASLLLLASGEVIFEERFEGSLLLPVPQFSLDLCCLPVREVLCCFLLYLYLLLLLFWCLNLNWWTGFPAPKFHFGWVVAELFLCRPPGLTTVLFVSF